MVRETAKLHISERDFSSQVESLLKLFNWRWCHFRPAQTQKGWRTPLSGDKGIPDYIAVRKGRLLFAELKDETTQPTPEQEAWLEDLRECVKMITLEAISIGEGIKHNYSLVPSLEVYLWRPDQIDEVTEILR